ncbi:MAG: 4,5-dioxygenase [Rhizobiaceae bacterium]|nr:4,5-dioxygenase [Rhizobiaceae bacterium]
MSEFAEFHAHVYFDESNIDAARNLCEAASSKFGITMGRMHEKPVGPHPRWSCQLLILGEQFGEVIPWLSVNRGDLTVFIHGQSEDVLADHTQHAMWMGELLELNLSSFGK